MKRILFQYEELQYMEWRSYNTKRHYDSVLYNLDLIEPNQWLQERGITIGVEHVRYKKDSNPWIVTTVFVWLDDELWAEYRLVWC